MIDLTFDTFEFNNTKFLEKYENQHFRAVNSTDRRVCIDVVSHMQLSPGCSALEPCAGYGEYLYALHAADACIDVVEIDEHGFQSLPPIYTSATNTDFLEYEVTRAYDAAIINPPFRGKTNRKRTYTQIAHKVLDNMADNGVVALHLHPMREAVADLVILHKRLDEQYELVKELNYSDIIFVNIYRKK